MKGLKLSKILFLMLFISCSKSKENEMTAEETYQMEVSEYKTNIPLASVQTDLYRCSDYDNIFGCKAKQIFATRFTDNNGRYSLTQNELNSSNQEIVLHKAKYWNAEGGPGKIYMSPEAWIDLHLIRQNNYPNTSLFRFKIMGESGIGKSYTFSSPIDTVLKVRAVGNELNTLTWEVIIKDKACYQYCIIDTLAQGVLTQNPEKFVTSSLTLSY